MARERLSSGAVNPDRDKWQWDLPPRSPAAMRELYAAAHLPILEILHGGPRHLKLIRNSPYPQDMVEAVRSWTTLGRQFGKYWGGTEVWNEPDLAAVPADQYVTLVKTAAYAFPVPRRAGEEMGTGSEPTSRNAEKNGHGEVPVPISSPARAMPLVGGVYAGMPPGAFFDTCAANGMLEHVDAVSFHSYGHVPDVEDMVRATASGSIRRAARQCRCGTPSAACPGTWDPIGRPPIKTPPARWRSP